MISGFTVVADEEVVGWSTRRLAARLPKVDAVIVAEPTELQIQPVEGGLVHMRIEIDGRESHAGNRYKSIHAGALGAEGGINAIEKGLLIMEALQRLERDWAIYRSHPLLPPGFNSIMPGMISGRSRWRTRRQAEPDCQSRHLSQLLLDRIQHLVSAGRNVRGDS